MTGLETEKGIKIIIIVQVITLIVGVVTIISAILLFARTGVGLFFIGLFCLLSIGILVLSIIGLVKIYRGRQEFGEEHAQKVKTGMILIIVGICVTLFIGPIGGILSGLGFVFLIVKIAQKKYRTLLWAGFGMSILASVMNLVSLVMQFSSADSITVLGGVNIFMGASGLVGSILTLMAYHGTYKGIKEGIISPFTAQSLMPPSGYDSLPPDLFPPKYPPSDHLGAYTPQTQIPPPPPEHYQGSALYKKPNLNNNDNSNDVRTDFMETKYTTKEDITDTLYEEKGSFQENDIELHGEYKLEERKKDRPIDRVDNTSTDSRLQNSSLCGQEVDY